MTGEWKGTEVRNADGREGRIESEFLGFGFRGLNIKCSDGSEAYVELAESGPDAGEAGWEWWCPTINSNGGAWLRLGTPAQNLEQDDAPRWNVP